MIPQGAFDIETDPFKFRRVPEPFATCIYFEDKVQVVWGDNCIEKTVELFRAMPKCILWCHNGGKFDFWYLLSFAEAGELKIVNGRIMEIKIGKVTLRDSYPLIPIPLAAYKKDKIDYAKFEAHRREKYRREITEYLVDDCVYLLELVTEFSEVVGRKHRTIGAAALAAIKKSGVKLWHSKSAGYDAKFRPYFYGGRVQVFEPGIHAGRFEYMDINSAYPAAMRGEHPNGPTYKRKADFDGRPQSFVHLLARSRGALPLRSGEGLDFVDDGEAHEFFATGHEIIAGLETETLDILKIMACYSPARTISFAPFVDEYYAMRRAAKGKNEVEYLAYKLLLNSGYGKTGINCANFQDWIICDRGESPGTTWEHESDFGEMAIFSKPAPSEDYIDVAVAASITGQVRAQLWRAICASDRPMYCDTDSLLCGKFHGERDERVLGAWKKEMTVTTACLAGKKLYALKNANEVKIASKGVKLTYQEIEKISKGGAITHQKMSPAFSMKYGARFTKRKIRLKTG